MTSTAARLPEPSQGTAASQPAEGEHSAARPRRSGSGSFAPQAPAEALLISIWRVLDTSVALGVLTLVFLATNASQLSGDAEEFLAMRISVKNLLLFTIFIIAWPGIFRLLGLYDVRRVQTHRAESLRVIVGCLLGSAIVLLFPLASRSGTFTAFDVFQFCIGTIAVTLVVRGVIHSVAEVSCAAGVRRILIVGSGPRALGLYRRLVDDSQAECEVLGFVDSDPQPQLVAAGVALLGALDDLEHILVREVVDEVHIALPMHCGYAQVRQAIEVCERVGVEIKYLADMFDSVVGKPRLEADARFPVVSVRMVADDYRLLIKRAIDLVGASAVLVVVSPLLPVIVLGIRLTSPGPVLFSQERYGLKKRRFRMQKFRTMVIDAESLQTVLEDRNEARGPVFKMRNDPRVTPIGRILRRTSLDELPQLLNVLQGDMSLVGPRPLPLRDVSRFEEAWLMRRFSVRPGMTGLWQVSGRSSLPFQRWMALDLQYIDEWSLALDLRILALTVPAVFRGTGAA